MHTLIHGTFVSLDNILSVSNILNDNCFSISYHSGKDISFLFTTSQLPKSVLFQYNGFYFAHYETFLETYKKIIKLLVDADQSS